jgi:hypothetical protein
MTATFLMQHHLPPYMLFKIPSNLCAIAAVAGHVFHVFHTFHVFHAFHACFRENLTSNPSVANVLSCMYETAFGLSLCVSPLAATFFPELTFLLAHHYRRSFHFSAVPSCVSTDPTLNAYQFLQFGR